MEDVHLKKEEMVKNKYYYDYTRNMSEERISKSYCGRPCCIDNDDCDCMTIDSFEWEQTITADETNLNYYVTEQS